MSLDETKIRAMIILDIIGKPEKHLLDSLQKVIDEIDKEKGVSVKMKDIKVPTLMKEQKDFFTTFAEIEVEVENMTQMAILLFKYMPAHIEIVSPEILAMTSNNWNDILNELARRLHSYDEIARMMQIENQMFMKKIEELGGKVPNVAQILKEEAEKAEEAEKKKEKKKK